MSLLRYILIAAKNNSRSTNSSIITNPAVGQSSRIHFLTTFLLLTLSLTACEMKKNMDEMHDMTEQMNNKTTKLSAVGCNTYIDLRQGNSFMVRKQAIDSMHAVDNDYLDFNPFENSTSSRFFQAKVAYAAAYFQAFEFQLEKKSDNACLPLDKSKERMKEAMGEFFRLFASYWRPSDLANIEIDPSNKEERVQNMMALSVAMHFENINQYSDTKTTGEDEWLSVYDLIKLALAKSNDVDSGKIKFSELPTWAQEILERRQEALYIIQLRYNMFTAMAFNLMNDVVSGPTAQLIKFAYYDTLYADDFKWDAALEQKSIGELERIHRYLDAAIKARNNIKRFAIPGYEPKLDDKLRRFMGTLLLHDKPSNAKSTEALVLRQKILHLAEDLAAN